MVCLVINGDKLKNETLLVNSLKENIPNLKSVVINSNKEKTNVITGTKIEQSMVTLILLTTCVDLISEFQIVFIKLTIVKQRNCITKLKNMPTLQVKKI